MRLSNIFKMVIHPCPVELSHKIYTELMQKEESSKFRISSHDENMSIAYGIKVSNLESMKKVLLVLFAFLAVAGSHVEAKSISKTPVGCWSFINEHEPMCRRISGGEQDTLAIYYRTDFDSLVLCPKGIGLLKYRFTKRIVSSTKDGYEKVLDSVEEYDIRIKWKYRKNKVHIRARYSDVSYTHVERTTDNRDGEFPSHFDNNVDEDGVEWMINTLPSYVYYPENTENERLFSCDYLDYYHHCKGKPSIPTSIEQ